MLRFEAIVGWPRTGVKWSWFASARLALGGLPFSGTAVLAALVTTAVEGDSTNPHTLRSFLGALMTDGGRDGSAAAACDRDGLQARHALSRMAYLPTPMTT